MTLAAPDALPAIATALRAVADALERLAGSEAQPAPAPMAVADQSVPQLAERFGRKPSTVRAWLEAGRFPGAYKLSGRDWRAPAASIAAFEQAERTRGAGTRRTGGATSLRRGKTPDLAAWRRRTG